ncbi:MAG: Gfa-like protein [uncultured Rubellimicrobium sp.]|uniref:Gfa-like protein n=1 Tax=uncultured Rubellimicrobium sp. TaxID=543078 RepID=A0A6J4P1V0_9RHOB|nr:MAG: Gfa-like protein [uncultured Rubellimicrobium sp.]
MTSAPLTGHCLCGAVTVTVRGTHDPRVGACHCRMCQRWSGGLFLCFNAEDVEAQGPVQTYASSSFSERAFCATCGSHLWFHDLDKPAGTVELMPGLFDAARDWPMRSEIYTDRKLASIDLAGDHPRATRAEYESKNPFVEGDTP